MGSCEEELEQVLGEVEAMEAVYGNDFDLVSSFPPLFHLSLFPRTADDSSQQFVQAILQIRTTPQYPKEPPCVDIVDCKGMDDNRRNHLLQHIQTKAEELCPAFMLVALCEEAVEKLSAMNHPDGDCPLCLLPLVPIDQQSETLPFMKLMSCFHCFHSECIVRWWNYLQKSKETDSAKPSSANMHPNKDNYKKVEEGIGNCPVCRKPFHAKDLEHVLDLVGSHSSQVSLDSDKATDEEELLQSEHEIIRRQKFEAILNLQKENSGLIEPKKDLVILPGMYLPQPAATPSSTSTKESDEQQEKEIPTAISEKHGGETSNAPSSSRHRNSGARRQRPRSDNHSSSAVRNPRKPVQQQWVKRDNNPSSKQ